VTAVVARLLGLRRDELLRVLPIALLYAVVLATMYVLKPARNALFLERFGARQLPYVLVLVAVVGAIGATAYGRWSNAPRVQRTIVLLFPALGGCLALFWWLLPLGWGWLVYAFYVWVNLYGLVATSLIWLLANTVFDPREARRVFGLIGAAGIAGAIAGGTFTQAAVAAWGTHNLLLVGAAAMFGCAGLSLAPTPLETAERRSRGRPRPTGAIAAVRQSQLLTRLAPMVALAGLVSVLVDIQFNAVVDESFDSTDQKAAFFGTFFALLNAGAFLFQLLLAPRVLAHLGLGAALVALPLGLAGGSAALLVLPVLASAVVAKAADGGLRHSLNRSATEILFLPVPVALKQKAKILLDTTVDNVGSGIGAACALLLTAGLSLHYRYLSVLALAGSAVWLLLALRVRRAYLEEFRQALSRRRIDPEQLRTKLSDSAAVQSLLAALESGHEQQAEYALDVLATSGSPSLIGPAKALLSHRSASIRGKAVRALQQLGDTTARKEVERLLDDPDEDARIEAVHYLCTVQSGAASSTLKSHLATGDARIQAAALGCVARHWGPEARAFLTPTLIESVLAYRGPERESVHRQLARALAHLPAEESVAPLRGLAQDASPVVRSAAIEAAGAARSLGLAPWLVSQLSDRSVRRAALHALAGFGATVLPVLAETLSRSDTPPVVRFNVWRVLGAIRTQQTVDLLFAQLSATPPPGRINMLKALNKLRSSNAGLRFPTATLRALLDEELELHARLRDYDPLQVPDSASPASALLCCALREKQHESLARIFRLLGLVYPPNDIYNAYLAIVSSHRMARSSAIEFLDNLLDREIASRLLPLLESPAPRGTARDRAAPEISETERWLAALLANEDRWLRACAAYAALPLRSAKLRVLLKAAEQDADPIVRETAALVLTQ